MEKKYIIGIDIGGTNTDAVLIDENQKIIAACKTITTEKLSDGFTNAIKILIKKSNIDINNISRVNVGTTHATNALLQKKDLLRVGVIRIAGNKPILPPAYAWPKDIKSFIYKDQVTINGGFECDGKEIHKFNKEEVYKAIDELISKGSESIAIVGVFSPIKNEQEIITYNIVKETLGKDFPVTMSSEIGGVGFIERENSAILNCALTKCIKDRFNNLYSSLIDLKINAPLFMTQNNGTIIDINKAIKYPILTVSAGPTNSFVGGTKLANLVNAIIVDIGGTSTDVGIVLNGFARRTINTSSIAGIQLNFPMPDVLSIALGGGSIIKINSNNSFMIGPESCAKKILQSSIALGGKTLTLTDISLLCNYLQIPEANPSLVNLSLEQCKTIINFAVDKIMQLIKKIAGPKKFPIVFVGGGAKLLPKNIEESLFPEYSDVANAYGAALSEISGNIDTIISLSNREEILEKLKEDAIIKAILNGADKNNVRIINQQIIPYHYVPGNLARVIITASGNSN